MSIEAMLWAFKQNPDRSTEKLVLLELSNHAGTDNTAWPSLARICSQTNLNRKTVISALDGLEYKGLISDTRERKGQSLQIKVYKLSLQNTLNEIVPETVRLSETVPFIPDTVPFLPSDSTENGTRNLLLNLKECNTYKHCATPVGFAAFWDAFPRIRRGSKTKCEQLWSKRKLESKANEILAHLAFKLNDWEKENFKYAPGALPYLNKEEWDGWEDTQVKPRYEDN